MTSTAKRYPSPLRYPGGKGSFALLLESIITRNDLGVPSYFEPFAGGAGAAVKLLFAGKVQRIALNDADRRIYCFWRTVLKETDRFVDRVQSVPLSISQWKSEKLISSSPQSHSDFDVGFSTFYLNRCNRSGVIRGAGPIGGFDQTTRYKIDARFNRDDLSERIRNLGDFADRITIQNLDALDFLKKSLPRGSERKRILAYVDPPYFKQGKRLYMNYYKNGDHEMLADYLQSQKTLPWIVSYDDCPEIRNIYSGCIRRGVKTWYSLQVRGLENELLIYPRHLSVPRSV